MTVEISAIFGIGLFSARPAAGNAGAHYFATDTGIQYRDNGASWVAENPITLPQNILVTGDISPAQLTANTDDWNPTGLSTAAVIRASTDASRNLTGLQGGSDGRVILLCNVGANNLVLVHDATSTAANRFYCPSDANLTLAANTGVLLIYDSTSSRWRISGGTTNYATPALTLSTSNSAGSATTAIRSDATIAAFDATTPANVGTAATGAAGTAARRDHVHATGAGTPSTQAFGDSPSTGTGPAAAMTDHKHGMPAAPALADHSHTTTGDGGVMTQPEVSTDILLDNQGGDPASPAAGKVKVYTKAAGLFIKTSAGTVVGPMVDATGSGGLTSGTPALTLSTTNSAGAASTGVATDATIAAFDATVPAGVGAAAATGSAGFAARRDHVHPLASGTSFPGSPATNDVYFRTDLGLLCYYDGTRWLTVQQYTEPITYQDALAAITTSGGNIYVPLWNGAYDIWIDRIIASTTVLSTNDGTKNWTVQFQRAPSNTNLGSSFSTGTGPDTPGTNTAHTVTVGAASGTTDRYVTAVATKNSTPGGLYLMGKIVYRLIVT